MDNSQWRVPDESLQQDRPLRLNEKMDFIGGCLSTVSSIWWIEVGGAILVGLYGLLTGRWPLFLVCLIAAIVGSILALFASLQRMPEILNQMIEWKHESLVIGPERVESSSGRRGETASTSNIRKAEQ